MDATSVECPSCGAHAGSRCRTPAGKNTSPHSSRAALAYEQDAPRRAAEAERERAYLAWTEETYRWTDRFPLTSTVLRDDVRSVPPGRLIHVARAAERWQVHPSLVWGLVYNESHGTVETYDSWDPHDTKGGMFPEDTSRWWA